MKVNVAHDDDKPYARFVEEQVAGDALFPNSPEATVALGFLAAGPWDDTLMVTIREDTIDHRIGQNLDRDGMVSAVMGTFQSLTVHCARCRATATKRPAVSKSAAATRPGSTSAPIPSGAIRPVLTPLSCPNRSTT